LTVVTAVSSVDLAVLADDLSALLAEGNLISSTDTQIDVNGPAASGDRYRLVLKGSGFDTPGAGLLPAMGVITSIELVSFYYWQG
jgi:hypothetical protein